jgi:hypothetical protein
MYVEYTVMKIYVIVYINIFSFFMYNYHEFYTLIILLKSLKLNLNFFLMILYHEILCSCNNLFLKNECVFKSHKHSLIY